MSEIPVISFKKEEMIFIHRYFSEGISDPF